MNYQHKEHSSKRSNIAMIGMGRMGWRGRMEGRREGDDGKLLYISNIIIITYDVGLFSDGLSQ